MKKPTLDIRAIYSIYSVTYIQEKEHAHYLALQTEKEEWDTLVLTL